MRTFSDYDPGAYYDELIAADGSPVPDRMTSIRDVTTAVDAFRGQPYPFTPGPVPCP